MSDNFVQAGAGRRRPAVAGRFGRAGLGHEEIGEKGMAGSLNTVFIYSTMSLRFLSSVDEQRGRYVAPYAITPNFLPPPRLNSLNEAARRH